MRRASSLTQTVLLALAWSLSLASAEARPLTVGDIQRARKIGIMPGSFDPFTEGHRGSAEAAVREGGLDFTILLPIDNPSKNPASVPVRLEMIDRAVSSSEKLLYPKSDSLAQSYVQNGLTAWIRKIRKINPAVEISVVVGTDVAEDFLRSLFIKAAIRPKTWLISPREKDETFRPNKLIAVQRHQSLETASPLGISSSGVKRYLKQHPEVYANASGEATVVPGIHPGVASYIAQNQLYSSVSETNKQKPSRLQCLAKFSRLTKRPPLPHPSVLEGLR